MSTALVQTNAGGSGSGTITTLGGTVSCTGTFGSTTNAGSMLVGLIYFNGSGTLSYNFTASTPGITWTSSQQPLWNTGGGSPQGQVAIFYSQNAASVSSATNNTFSVVGTTGVVSLTVTIECSLYEISGVLQSGNPIRAQASRNNQTGGTPFSSHALSLLDQDFAITVFNGNSGLLSAGAGWILGPNPSVVHYGGSQYMANAATGSYDATFSGGTETRWGAGHIAFNPAPTATSTTYGFFFGD